MIQKTFLHIGYIRFSIFVFSFQRAFAAYFVKCH